MGQGRTLTNKIDQASLAIARQNAAKPARVVKYMHVGERMRYLAHLQAAAKLERATIEMPNRAS